MTTIKPTWKGELFQAVQMLIQHVVFVHHISSIVIASLCFGPFQLLFTLLSYENATNHAHSKRRLFFFYVNFLSIFSSIFPSFFFPSNFEAFHFLQFLSFNRFLWLDANEFHSFALEQCKYAKPERVFCFFGAISRIFLCAVASTVLWNVNF